MNPNCVTGTIYEIQWFSKRWQEWNGRAFTNDLKEARGIHRFESKNQPDREWRIVKVTRKVIAK